MRISDKIPEKIATALEKQWKNWRSGRRKIRTGCFVRLNDWGAAVLRPYKGFAT
jgi:hypothetical protein